MPAPTIRSAGRALAVLIAVALAVGETVRRWGAGGEPPAWLDD